MRGFAAIGLYSPKTSVNIGAALRAAHCFGASLMVIENARYRKALPDVTKAYRHLPLIHSPLMDALPHDCVPIGIEITEDAESLVDFTHPHSAYYLFGPEDGSLPNKIVDRCKYVVSIPTRFCLNLAMTVNVVLYDRAAKALRRGAVT